MFGIQNQQQHKSPACPIEVSIFNFAHSLPCAPIARYFEQKAL